MSFVVDGSDWNFYGVGPADIAAHIDAVLAFVQVCNDRGEEVWIGEDFQSRPMLGTDGLWQLAADQGLSGEMKQELAAWLGRTSFYLDIDEWPDGFDEVLIEIDVAAPADNADVAWVHHHVRAGRAFACLSLRRRGLLPTRTKFGDADLHFVGDEQERVAFWRDAIKIEGDNVASLVRFAPSAYPNIYFMPGVVANVDRFEGGYLALRTQVQKAFEALDRHGVWIFTEAPPALNPEEPRRGTQTSPTNQIIEKRFLNVGLNAAPENPNVRLKKMTRVAREAKIGKATLYCEWHIKVQPHRNRIHVHGPVEASDCRVIVGMIDDHLPLP